MFSCFPSTEVKWIQNILKIFLNYPLSPSLSPLYPELFIIFLHQSKFFKYQFIVISRTAVTTGGFSRLSCVRQHVKGWTSPLGYGCSSHAGSLWAGVALRTCAQGTTGVLRPKAAQSSFSSVFVVIIHFDWFSYYSNHFAWFSYECRHAIFRSSNGPWHGHQGHAMLIRARATVPAQSCAARPSDRFWQGFAVPGS